MEVVASMGRMKIGPHGRIGSGRIQMGPAMGVATTDVLVVVTAPAGPDSNTTAANADAVETTARVRMDMSTSSISVCSEALFAIRKVILTSHDLFFAGMASSCHCYVASTEPLDGYTKWH